MPLNVRIDPHADPVEVRRAAVHLAADACRRSFPHYFRFNPPAMNYVYGTHTNAIIDALSKVSRDVQLGISRYVCLCIPYRHGKSDIASRVWPVWHLGNNPEHEFMQVSYNDDIAMGFSRFVRGRFRKTGKLWDLQIDAEHDQTSQWSIADHAGSYHATSFGGTAAGRGAHILGIDDYFKNREIAESKHMRERIWESFTNDFMTRRAPVHAVVITANRWHEDDVVGRIMNKNDPQHKDYDPNFPAFEIVRFSAQNEDGSWLFPERFSPQWYESMRATLGTYAWGAMGQQDPKPRHGRLLRADLVQIVDPAEWVRMEAVKKALWCRGWDLASTAREIARDDPDASCGTKAAVVDGGIYVEDVIHGHWRGTTRNEIIKNAALADGPECKVIIEVVAGYTDAYDNVRQILAGERVVRKFVPATDKVARATCLEPAFEVKHVFIKRAEWNAAWIDEVVRFPEGQHDDRVDSLVVAVHDALARKYSVQVA